MTLSNGWGNVLQCVCVYVCVNQNKGRGAWRLCVKVVILCRLTDAGRKRDLSNQGWNSISTLRTRASCACVSVHACLLMLTCTCVCSDWQAGSWERADRVWIQAWSHAYLMNRLLMMGKPELNGLCRALVQSHFQIRSDFCSSKQESLLATSHCLKSLFVWLDVSPNKNPGNYQFIWGLMSPCYTPLREELNIIFTTLVFKDYKNNHYCVFIYPAQHQPFSCLASLKTKALFTKHWWNDR